MAVVINEMESTVETASAPAPAPSGGMGDLSEADFRLKYGEYVRTLLREELERHLRSAAD